MSNAAERREKTLAFAESLSVPIRLYENGENAETLSEHGVITKNLFLKEHNSNRYFIVVADGKKRVDIKSIRRYLGVKPLSFATEQSLAELFGIEDGAVTPLAVLFDADNLVSVVIDDDFRTDATLLGMAPCDDTATVFMTYKELEKYAEGCRHTLINMQI